MAPKVKNVVAAKPSKVTGGVSWAPVGVTLPTDASTPLGVGIKPLGYVSAEGIQPSRDTTIEKVKAWGGDVVAALLTDDSQSFVFKLVEFLSQNVNEWIYGKSNVSVTPANGQDGTKMSIADDGHKIEDSSLIFDMFHGGNKMRVVVPFGDCVVTGEDAYVDGSIAGYEITVEALKDDNGKRVYRHYELGDGAGNDSSSSS